MCLTNHPDNPRQELMNGHLHQVLQCQVVSSSSQLFANMWYRSKATYQVPDRGLKRSRYNHCYLWHQHRGQSDSLRVNRMNQDLAHYSQQNPLQKYQDYTGLCSQSTRHYLNCHPRSCCILVHFEQQTIENRNESRPTGTSQNCFSPLLQ